MTHPEAPAHRKGKQTVDEVRIAPAGVAFQTAHEKDTHPHACTDGLVFLTYTVFDGGVGDEVERLEVLPCRRCAEAE
jgi:hypothetical protein